MRGSEGTGQVPEIRGATALASGGHLQFSSSSCPVLTALATAAPRAREVCKVFFEVRSFSPSFIHSFFPPDTGARAKVAGPTRMSLEFHNLPLLCWPQAGPLVAACPLGLSGTGVFQSPLFERVRGAAGDGRRGGGAGPAGRPGDSDPLQGSAWRSGAGVGVGCPGVLGVESLGGLGSFLAAPQICLVSSRRLGPK